MPIYEYVCKSCKHEFEALLRSSKSADPACESCGGSKVERRMSMPAVKTETTKAASMRAAKKRDQKQGDERTRAQREYEQSHND